MQACAGCYGIASMYPSARIGIPRGLAAGCVSPHHLPFVAQLLCTFAASEKSMTGAGYEPGPVLGHECAAASCPLLVPCCFF